MERAAILLSSLLALGLTAAQAATTPSADAAKAAKLNKAVVNNDKDIGKKQSEVNKTRRTRTRTPS
ncbi:MAG TPA: hypothetical protein VLV87_06350 [Gammaproteobacteria bacterium]|nr:hypothetical protein [Gammaproteobacteria bacterium]